MTARRTTGRRPADQAVGRQDMWLAIKELPEAVTVTDVVAATGLHRSTVLRYFKALTAAGHLEETPAPAGQASSWTLIHDVGHHAPRVRRDGSQVSQGAATEQLWRAMQMLKEFTFVDLIQHCSVVVTEGAARCYCKHLLAADYLRVLRKASPVSGQIALYRLIRNTGPKAPQVQRVKRIYDPNTDAVYGGSGQ